MEIKALVEEQRKYFAFHVTFDVEYRRMKQSLLSEKVKNYWLFTCLPQIRKWKSIL